MLDPLIGYSRAIQVFGSHQWRGIICVYKFLVRTVCMPAVLKILTSRKRFVPVHYYLARRPQRQSNSELVMVPSWRGHFNMFKAVFSQNSLCANLVTRLRLQLTKLFRRHTILIISTFWKYMSFCCKLTPSVISRCDHHRHTPQAVAVSVEP